MDVSKNLQNMKKLDDSWNAQDLETFRRCHVKDCIVRWPNQPPTHGIDAHEQEAIAFFKMFPDQHLINNPHHAGAGRMDVHGCGFHRAHGGPNDDSRWNRYGKP